MLPKSKRLESGHFQAMRRARVWHVQHFFARAVPAERGRAAVVVSAAVSKKAVTRNLLRRRVYSVLKTCGLPFAFTAITAKKGAAALSFRAVSDEVMSLLQKVREAR